MGYDLGVDLGGTTVVAAVLRDGEARAEVVPLGTDGALDAPACAHRGADGVVRTGDEAQRRGVREPERVVREVTSRLGDEVPLIVGGEPWPADDVAAEIVLAAVRRVAAREGGGARALAVTHPAGWGLHRERTLRRALVRVGLGHATLVAEPRAAVLAASVLGGLRAGRVAGVFDLGGHGFHATVLRRGRRSSDGGTGPVRLATDVLADSGETARIGGIDVDAAVLAVVREELGDDLESAQAAMGDDEASVALAALRTSARRAKERLSSETEADVVVDLPGLTRTVRITRADLEARVWPLVAEAVDRFVATADAAGTELDQVLLAGGSSRMPLVSRLLAEELGRPVHTTLDPALVVAQGAALAAAEHAVALRHEGSPRPAAARAATGVPRPRAEDPAGTTLPVTTVGDRHDDRARASAEEPGTAPPSYSGGWARPGSPAAAGSTALLDRPRPPRGDVPRPPVTTMAAPIGANEPRTPLQRYRPWILAAIVLAVLVAAAATVPIPGLTSARSETPVPTTTAPAPTGAAPAPLPSSAAPPPSTTADAGSDEGSSGASSGGSSGGSSEGADEDSNDPTTSSARASRTSPAAFVPRPSRTGGTAASGDAAPAAPPAAAAPPASPPAPSPAVPSSPAGSSSAPSSAPDTSGTVSAAPGTSSPGSTAPSTSGTPS